MTVMFLLKNRPRTKNLNSMLTRAPHEIIKMFKFFPDVVEEDKHKSQDDPGDQRSCEEIQVKQLHYDIAAQVPFLTLDKNNLGLKYTKVSAFAESKLVSGGSKVKNILESSSDLNSGEYEGGFKLWECTFDLLSYLQNNPNLIEKSASTKVLDLGCGHGILGFYALKNYGATVIFQDYNAEVIEYLTIPNTIHNFGDEGLSRSRFFAGSWKSLNDLLKRGVLKKEDFQFDVILSSETIYNTNYLKDFIELVENCLKPQGSLFLAAKTCYFGVGGGTKSLVAHTKKENSKLTAETVKVIRDGIQREVLHIKSTKIL